MKDPLIKGHPLHAILTDLPIGALVLGATFDGLGLVTRRPVWRFAARANHTAALLSGCAAALVGLWDYQAVPSEHPARRTGAIHGSLNGAMLALLLSSVLLRRDEETPPAALAFSTAALAVLGASGALGGELVFRLGWRVAPAEHAEQLEEALRARGETGLIDTAYATVREYEQAHALVP